MLGFTMIQPFKFRCDTCGEIVPSGILNITDHFSKCFGKDLCENVKKIDESNLNVDDKMDLAKNIFSVTQ